MQNDFGNTNKKHGALIIIVSIFLIVALLLLSDGWVNQWSLMSNLNRIYLYRINHYSIYDPDTFVYTKYFLVACFAMAAYGITLVFGILNSPFKKKL